MDAGPFWSAGISRGILLGIQLLRVERPRRYAAVSVVARRPVALSGLAWERSTRTAMGGRRFNHSARAANRRHKKTAPDYR